MWRTAFGSPVVPELKTRTASSSAPIETSCAGRFRPSAIAAATSRVVEVDDRSVAELPTQQLDGVGIPHRRSGIGHLQRVADLARLPRRADQNRGGCRGG